MRTKRKLHKKGGTRKKHLLGFGYKDFIFNSYKNIVKDVIQKNDQKNIKKIMGHIAFISNEMNVNGYGKILQESEKKIQQENINEIYKKFAEESIQEKNTENISKINTICQNIIYNIENMVDSDDDKDNKDIYTNYVPYSNQSIHSTKTNSQTDTNSSGHTSR